MDGLLGCPGMDPVKKIPVWGCFLGCFLGIFFQFFPHIFTFKRVVYWIAIYLCIYWSNICRVVPAMQGCPLAVGLANGEISSHGCSISQWFLMLQGEPRRQGKPPGSKFPQLLHPRACPINLGSWCVTQNSADHQYQLFIHIGNTRWA